MQNAKTRWIPPNRVEIKLDDSGSVVYVSEASGRFYGLCYVGRAIKPTWNYSFKTAESREQYIEKTRGGLKAKAEAKAKRLLETKSFIHGFKVGDILYSSWGYDQTNIDFYEVVKVPSGKSVVIRAIKSREIQQTAWAQGDVVPIPGDFTGDPMMKRVYGSYHGRGDTNERPDPGSVTITSYASAWLWDGKPKHYTAYA